MAIQEHGSRDLALKGCSNARQIRRGDFYGISAGGIDRVQLVLEFGEDLSGGLAKVQLMRFSQNDAIF